MKTPKWIKDYFDDPENLKKDKDLNSIKGTVAGKPVEVRIVNLAKGKAYKIKVGDYAMSGRLTKTMLEVRLKQIAKAKK